MAKSNKNHVLIEVTPRTRRIVKMHITKKDVEQKEFYKELIETQAEKINSKEKYI
jgi:hypothetical protein